MYHIRIANLMTLKLCGQYLQQNGWDHSGGINRDHNILVYLTSGECSFTINSKIIYLKQNDIILLPKNTHFIPHTPTKCEYKYFHFVADVISADITRPEHTFYNQDNNQPLLFPEKFSSDDSFVVLFDNILNLLSDTTPEGNIKMNTSFINILIRISSMTNRKLITEIANKMSDYISKNIKCVTLNSLATHFGYSKQHIIRIFKDNFNTTPTEYIISKKLASGIIFFTQGKMTIAEAAYEAGFTDPNYFSRCFKKKYSLSPSEYKKQFIGGI